VLDLSISPAARPEGKVAIERSDLEADEPPGMFDFEMERGADGAMTGSADGAAPPYRS
jgi:hypothetical protein